MLHIASDDASEAQSKALRSGFTKRRPPTINPAKWCHAFEEPEEMTLCGLPVGDLNAAEFPEWDFAQVAPGLRCREYDARAGAPTPGIA
jgi:hypothetical protein